MLTTACLALGVVVTQVQANIPSPVENIANNTHQIPDELNPKLHWKEYRLTTAGKVDQGDLLVKPEDTVKNEGDQVDAIHSIAMKDNKSFSKPIYDYTAGTSN